MKKYGRDGECVFADHRSVSNERYLIPVLLRSRSLKVDIEKFSEK